MKFKPCLFPTRAAIRMILLLGVGMLTVSEANAQRQMERLGRGIIVLRSSSTQVYVGWRLLGNDPSDVGFNLYRAANGGAPVKLNSPPLTNTTDYVDTPPDLTTTAYTYSVQPVLNGVEVPDTWANPLSSPFTLPANATIRQYFPVPLQATPDGAHKVKFCWVGDLDGDGEYDYVVDRYNASADTRQFLDAYKRDGTLLWRMDMGYNSTNHYNIEPGSATLGIGHGDNVTVFDLDGDGKAEVIVRTAKGVGFADGSVLTNAPDDNTQYISIIDGLTGVEKARATVPNPWLSDGPMNGHMGIFFPDGVRPSVLWESENRRTDNGFNMITTVWDYRNGQITQRWSWRRDNYHADVAHQIRFADVDNDGKDEYCDIAFALDDDGTLLFSQSEVGHGDRYHITDIDPERPGLERYAIQQDNASGLATFLCEAGTGKMIKKWYAGSVVDVGRGLAADIDPGSKGCEMFSTMANIYNSKGIAIYSSHPFPPESIWWDGDLTREFVGVPGSTGESPAIEKFNPANPGSNNRLYTIYNETPPGVYQAYGGRPAFWGDLFGDWREEMLVVANDNSELRIYTTKNPSTTRLYTLMHNGQYRDQTTTKGYVQSSYVDYYLGTGMEQPAPAPFSNAKLVWRGGGANDWDAGVTANWFTNNLWVSNTTPVVFNGESVLFDMTGSNNTAINLAGSLTPGEVTVYAPKDYTFDGAGSLDGAMKLTKAGRGKLIFTGTNNYTGNTLIAEGPFIVNGSLPSSPVTVRGGVWLDGRLGGSGVVGSAVSIRPGGGLSPGQGTNSPATLTVANNLSLLGLTLNDFDLSDDPTGTLKTNDLAVVTGNLTLQGTNTFVIHKLNATLTNGVYPLINYSGTLIGSLNGLRVSGLEGMPVTFANPTGQIALVVKNVRPPATITWTGGQNGNVWDLAVSSNWLNGVVKDVFVPLDSVRFDNTGSSNLTVNLNDSLAAADVIVDSTANYTLTGSGAIIGSGGIVKSNTGTLTISALNNYTGRTLIAGGTVVVSELDPIGFPGSLGNQNNSSPTNLVLSGNATLRVTGQSYTDRGMTLSAGTNSIDVPSGASQLTIAGTVIGSGTLQKLGSATLALTTSNSYTGGTIIQGGTIVLGGAGGTGNRYGIGTGSVTFINGTLSLLDLQSSYTYAYNFIVPTGGVGRVNCDGRSTMTGSLTGGGTFTVMTPYVRTDFGGNWTNFTGQINIIPDSDGGNFRLTSSAGLPNAKVNVASLVSFQNRVSGTPTLSIGELSGAQGSSVSGGTGNDGLAVNWSVGGLNTSATFAGNTYNNVGFIKVGTNGTWTLSGTNLTHTGQTTVNGGTLLYNGNGSNSTSVVTVGAAGTLGGTGIIGGTTTVNGKLAPGVSIGTLTFSGNLTFGAGGSAVMEIQKSDGTKDLATVGGTLTCGGTLVVTNLGGTLANGDTFKIFNAAAYAGSFSALNLPPLADGLAWDTTALNISGTLTVIGSGTVPPPDAPSELIATAVSPSQINLTWADNSTNENNFLIERSSPDSSNFAQAGSTGAGVTNYSDTGLSASTTCYYRVRAGNAGGNSAYSGTANATTLPAPASLVWRGDGAANAWDVGVSSNWFNAGNRVQFSNGSGVVFDDTGSNNVAVALTGSLQPASVTVNATKNYVLGGTGSIAGNISLIKFGTGAVTNIVSNTFNGGVIINGGILALGVDSGKNQKDSGLGTGPVTINTNGQLRLGGDAGGVVQHYITNAITLDGGTIFSVDGRQHLTNSTVTVAAGGGSLLTHWLNKDLLIESQLTGSGPLTVNFGTGGTGSTAVGALVYFSNPLNTYSGTITVLTNAIALTSPYALSNAILNAQGPGASANLTWSGITNIVLGGLSGAGNIPLGANQLQVGNNGSSTEYSGALVGNGPLVKKGGGTFTLIGTFLLSGTNTYSGLTTVSNGTLQIGNSGTTGTPGTNNIINNAMLAFNRSDTISYGGVISGTGHLAQIGDGTLALSNVHTYTGATTIESGTLALTGAGSIANSTSINISLDALLDVSGRTGGGMTLASGQTLSGNGAVKGNLALGSGAKLAPGNSIGALTFSNSLTLSADSVTTLEINHSPLEHDQVSVLGNLTCGGTLVVTNIGANTLAAGDSFPLFNAPALSGSFSSLALPALGTNLAWDTNSFLISGTLAVISTAPPAFNSVASLGDGNFRLTFSGPNGRNYELRATTNLALTPVTLWDLLDVGTFDNQPVVYDDLQATNHPQRFYRLQVP